MIELAPNHKRGLSLPGPLMNASGILGFAGEYRGLVDFASLGAFVTNALTYAPRRPARPPHVAAGPEGVLVHTGLPNPGVRAALRRFGREWLRLGIPVIVHLAATTPADVERSLEALDRAEGVGGIELGLREDASGGEMVSAIHAARGGPALVVRLPLARAAEQCELAAQAGADALTIGAPPRGELAVDSKTFRGRCYGPGQFAPALAAVQAVLARDLGLPVIAAGGIFSIDQAHTMLQAGAAAIQVDAALWSDPALPSRWAPMLAAAAPRL